MSHIPVLHIFSSYAFNLCFAVESLYIGLVLRSAQLVSSCYSVTLNNFYYCHFKEQSRALCAGLRWIDGERNQPPQSFVDMSKEILYALKATEKDINFKRQFLMNCFFVSFWFGIV